MSEIRELRLCVGLKQHEFAALLAVQLLDTADLGQWETRGTPAVLQRARMSVAQYRRPEELLPLDPLARELGVHLRTLQAAARTGRLETHFSVRSVFGRPLRSASRAAGEQFVGRHYRRFGGQQACPLCHRFHPTTTSTYDICVGAWA